MSSAQKLIKKYNNTRTLPHVVTKLSKLIHDENSTMKDFENVIKMDPTLVIRLLRLVNSPFYGLAQKVDSISRAVAFIGMKNLNNLAVTDALKNIFTSSGVEGDIFSRKQLWLHCAAVGICSKLLAERIFGINGDDAYLCGILHDIGIIVEEQVTQKAFLQACKATGSSGNLDIFEQEYLDTDHCEIGYMMTFEWAMPLAVQEAIRDHHKKIDDIKPESLTGILQISEYIMVQIGYPALPGGKALISPGLLNHLKENVDEYKVLIDDLPAEMEKAKDLYGSE